jgi:hypothetical protein
MAARPSTSWPRSHPWCRRRLLSRDPSRAATRRRAAAYQPRPCTTLPARAYQVTLTATDGNHLTNSVSQRISIGCVSFQLECGIHSAFLCRSTQSVNSALQPIVSTAKKQPVGRGAAQHSWMLREGVSPHPLLFLVVGVIPGSPGLWISSDETHPNNFPILDRSNNQSLWPSRGQSS